MPTALNEVPSKTWVPVATGATVTPISVEANGNYDRCYLALSATTPSFIGGHSLPHGQCRQVRLAAGEHLYVYIEYAFKSPCFIVVSS